MCVTCVQTVSRSRFYPYNIPNIFSHHKLHISMTRSVKYKVLQIEINLYPQYERMLAVQKVNPLENRWWWERVFFFLNVRPGIKLFVQTRQLFARFIFCVSLVFLYHLNIIFTQFEDLRVFSGGEEPRLNVNTAFYWINLYFLEYCVLF